MNAVDDLAGRAIPTTAGRRDERPFGEVRLVLTHPRGGDDARRVNLRITDAASLELLLDITMNAEEFADLMAGSHLRLAARIPDAVQAGHLFRQREHDSRPVPAQWTKSEYQRDEDTKAAVDRWASEIVWAEGWDEHTVELGSQSFYVSFRRWAARA